MTLDNRTALVTGASKGVGKGIALALGRAGCNVAVNYFPTLTELMTPSPSFATWAWMRFLFSGMSVALPM